MAQNCPITLSLDLIERAQKTSKQSPLDCASIEWLNAKDSNAVFLETQTQLSFDWLPGLVRSILIGCQSDPMNIINRKLKLRIGIILPCALVLSAANKGMLAAALFAVSGIFGMIGWAVWFGGIHKNDGLKALLTQLGSTSGFTIGYSHRAPAIRMTSQS